MKIKHEIYEQLINMPEVPPELGGILGCVDGIICDVFFDSQYSTMSSAIYKPNIVTLNKKIIEWQEVEIDFCGIFHSHPLKQTELSQCDIFYIRNIMNVMPLSIDILYFPIVIPRNNIYLNKTERANGSIIITKESIQIEY